LLQFVDGIEQLLKLGVDGFTLFSNRRNTFRADPSDNWQNGYQNTIHLVSNVDAGRMIICLADLARKNIA